MQNNAREFKGYTGRVTADGEIVDIVWKDIKQTSIQNLDASPENQDWLKTLSWDLPAYKSDEFLQQFNNLAAFRELPLYKSAVKAKLIVKDEWKGPKEGYCKIQ